MIIFHILLVLPAAVAPLKCYKQWDIDGELTELDCPESKFCFKRLSYSQYSREYNDLAVHCGDQQCLKTPGCRWQNITDQSVWMCCCGTDHCNTPRLPVTFPTTTTPPTTIPISTTTSNTTEETVATTTHKPPTTAAPPKSTTTPTTQPKPTTHPSTAKPTTKQTSAQPTTKQTAPKVTTTPTTKPSRQNKNEPKHLKKKEDRDPILKPLIVEQQG